RKTTGSYYTRPDLVQELIKSALKPVLEERLARAGSDLIAREAALLSLRTVDPACGSGAFLIAATDYLGRELARIRTDDDYPADRDLRRARRDVLMHCIYGVDMNPMAVELAKVSLWINSAVEDLPLNFLDHHIKCGNSLIGATPELLANGVPDEAFNSVTGDDKAVSRDLKRRNAKERTQLVLPFASSAPLLGNLAADYKRLVEMPEDTPEQVHAKRATYERLAAQMGDEHSGRLFADAWCAAFFWPLDRDHVSDAPTYGEVRKLEQSPWSASIFLKEEVRHLAHEQRFFHWHLEFPDVFAGDDPGFDCVLGNPPWERIKLIEEEFFAPRASEIAGAQNAAARKKLIATLPETHPALYSSYAAALRRGDAQGKFFRTSGRYPLTARGDINVYSIFAESDRGLVSSRGRAGIVVPTGIATDDTNKDFFADIVSKRALVSLFDFENRHDIFPGVGHGRQKFSLITLSADYAVSEHIDLLCFATLIDHIREQERHFTLSPADFALINPNTHTLPIFRSRRDAELTRRMYLAAPVLVDESDDEPVNPWGIRFGTLFHMSNDSHLFRTRTDLERVNYELDKMGVFHAPIDADDDFLPLYEGKLFWLFDPRYATFELSAGDDDARETSDVEHADPSFISLPRYWVERLHLIRKPLRMPVHSA
ncbi:MAG: Eco57I restriction-modification methylase domain-containing protein, partial [Ktedonobacterales bacterium]